jgi:hypothetical protein
MAEGVVVKKKSDSSIRLADIKKLLDQIVFKIREDLLNTQMWESEDLIEINRDLAKVSETLEKARLGIRLMIKHQKWLGDEVM